MKSESDSRCWMKRESNLILVTLVRPFYFQTTNHYRGKTRFWSRRRKSKIISIFLELTPAKFLIFIASSSSRRLSSNSNLNSLNLSFENKNLSRLNHIFIEFWPSVKWVLQHILHEILQVVDELGWKYDVDQHQPVHQRRSLHNLAVLCPRYP